MSCVLFCTPVITKGKARLAHTYVFQFCKGFEKLYGSEKATLNMHLHTHILDCILDYGPEYSFWLFSFERYNGLLGDYITNQRSPKIQLMRKFIGDQLVKDIPLPKLYDVNFKPIFVKLMWKHSGTLLASLQDCQSKIILEISLLAIGPIRKDNNGWKFSEQYSLYECCYPRAMECLEPDELTSLKGTYNAIFNGVNDASVTPHFEMVSLVKLAGELYGSLNSRSEGTAISTRLVLTLDLVLFSTIFAKIFKLETIVLLAFSRLLGGFPSIHSEKSLERQLRCGAEISLNWKATQVSFLFKEFFVNSFRRTRRLIENWCLLCVQFLKKFIVRFVT